MKYPIALLLLMACGTLFAKKNPTESSETKKIPNRSFYVETNPANCFMNGFSAAVGSCHPFNEKIRLGVGVHSGCISDMYIEENTEHIGKDWEAASMGFDVYLQRNLFYVNEGVTLGLTASASQITIERNDKSADFVSLCGTLRAGYIWYPFSNCKCFYFFPGVGLSNSLDFGGSHSIDGEIFSLPTVSVKPEFQIGFRF